MTNTFGIASSWLSAARIKRIEKAFPELLGEISRDDLGGKKASGCYVSNAQSKLRAQGEHKLADLLMSAAQEVK